MIFFFIPKNSLNIFCACLYRLLGTTFNLVHDTRTYIFFSCGGLAFKGWDSDGGVGQAATGPREKQERTREPIASSCDFRDQTR